MSVSLFAAPRRRAKRVFKHRQECLCHCLLRPSFGPSVYLRTDKNVCVTCLLRPSFGPSAYLRTDKNVCVTCLLRPSFGHKKPGNKLPG